MNLKNYWTLKIIIRKIKKKEKRREDIPASLQLKISNDDSGLQDKFRLFAVRIKM